VFDADQRVADFPRAAGCAAGRGRPPITIPPPTPVPIVSITRWRDVEPSLLVVGLGERGYGGVVVGRRRGRPRACSRTRRSCHVLERDVPPRSEPGRSRNSTTEGMPIPTAAKVSPTCGVEHAVNDLPDDLVGPRSRVGLSFGSPRRPSRKRRDRHLRAPTSTPTISSPGRPSPPAVTPLEGRLRGLRTPSLAHRRALAQSARAASYQQGQRGKWIVVAVGSAARRGHARAGAP